MQRKRSSENTSTVVYKVLSLTRDMNYSSLGDPPLTGSSQATKCPGDTEFQRLVSVTFKTRVRQCIYMAGTVALARIARGLCSVRGVQKGKTRRRDRESVWCAGERDIPDFKAACKLVVLFVVAAGRSQASSAHAPPSLSQWAAPGPGLCPMVRAPA